MISEPWVITETEATARAYSPDQVRLITGCMDWGNECSEARRCRSVLVSRQPFMLVYPGQSTIPAAPHPSAASTFSIRSSVPLPPTAMGHPVTDESIAVSRILSPSVMHRRGLRSGSDDTTPYSARGSPDSSMSPSPVSAAADAVVLKRSGLMESFLTHTNLRCPQVRESSTMRDRRSESMSPSRTSETDRANPR